MLLNTAYATGWTALVYLWSDDALLVISVMPDDLALDRTSCDVELAAVSTHWDGEVVTLRDEQAAHAALLSRAQEGQLAGYALLHLATHARMLPARGLAAHLKLWDGDMLLPEVAGLRLGGALVVLSACEGAAAKALPGETVPRVTPVPR